MQLLRFVPHRQSEIGIQYFVAQLAPQHVPLVEGKVGNLGHVLAS